MVRNQPHSWVHQLLAVNILVTLTTVFPTARISLMNLQTCGHFFAERLFVYYYSPFVCRGVLVVGRYHVTIIWRQIFPFRTITPVLHFDIENLVCHNLPIKLFSSFFAYFGDVGEIVDFKDLTPLVVDKNRQVLLSRREPNWQTVLAAKNVQTFGREPGGKVRLCISMSLLNAASCGLNCTIPFREPTCVPDQTVSEDRCNSLRLRTIIQSNIVANDAEASKRAVQSAAETETGQFFDAVCGTGFFSYIAHTDEFCLASMAGVNCYVFSPVCSEHPTTIFAKHRKTRRKVYLNRN
ncbi:unnamed protein product [Heligmosomoides polygyrus]|uniref:Ground-like domain-containing protein n=1 Tax=Heligmosomoides polygyrus TaxID=6339 RepID=A0A3P7X2G1_HELPZ|nr:unnamed protein product [Heligmosomoides polygyrus]